jgi:uncharacterized protein (UPF0548 family)
MFLLTRPTDRQIQDFITRQMQSGRLSYTQLEMTRQSGCPGFVTDQYSVRLGAGQRDFETACAAMKSWRMLQLGWAFVSPPSAPIIQGQTVAVAANHLGFWSLNACRIVYLIEGPTADNQSIQYGFAYGTLNEHIEIGEEQFCIQMNSDGSVWYQITAVSKPGHILAKIGYPVGRYLQKRFAKSSQSAMLAAMQQI